MHSKGLLCQRMGEINPSDREKREVKMDVMCVKLAAQALTMAHSLPRNVQS